MIDHVLQIRVLQIRVLQIRVLQIRVLQIRVLQISVLQIRVLQIRVLQIRVLQVRVLQIQSVFYKSNPVRVLQYASISSCLHLMAVVWERLAAIKFPYRYPYVLTKRNIKLAISFCWIYSASCRTSMVLLLGTKSGSLYGIVGVHVPIACVIFVSSSYVVLYS